MAARRDTFTIWARCAADAQSPQIAALQDRLTRDGDPVVIHSTFPGDHPETGREVKDRFGEIDLVLWLGGALVSATMRFCEAARIGVFIVLPDDRTVHSLPGPWIPGRRRAFNDIVRHVFARDADMLAAFRRAGVDHGKLSMADGLEERLELPDFDDQEMRHLTGRIGTRPVWLATEVAERDAETLAVAHKGAARRSHRLMLIVSPADPGDGAALAAHFREAGFHTARRSDGPDPDDSTDVLIADGDGEIGLWLRMAGITFLGGSLDHRTKIDPFVPASLGSVLIHGSHAGAVAPRLRRLQSVGATEAIGGATELGAAVEKLLSVEEAARKAAIGWDVVSHGAEMTEALAEMIFELYETRGAA